MVNIKNTKSPPASPSQKPRTITHFVINSNWDIRCNGCESASVSLLTAPHSTTLPPPHILGNLTWKQKVSLITPNDWKLLSCRRPGESSCSAVALIHVAYANVHPFERFSRNVMLFRLPIIVYIITPLHVPVEFWWMTPRSAAGSETDSGKHCTWEENFTYCGGKTCVTSKVVSRLLLVVTATRLSYQYDIDSLPSNIGRNGKLFPIPSLLVSNVETIHIRSVGWSTSTLSGQCSVHVSQGSQWEMNRRCSSEEILPETWERSCRFNCCIDEAGGGSQQLIVGLMKCTCQGLGPQLSVHFLKTPSSPGSNPMVKSESLDTRVVFELTQVSISFYSTVPLPVAVCFGTSVQEEACTIQFKAAAGLWPL